MVWQNGLLLVDRSLGAESELRGYAFPDPALFVSVTSGEKQISYLTNWLKLRSGVIEKVSRSNWKDCLVSNQMWRTVLTLMSKAGVDNLSTLSTHLVKVLGISQDLERQTKEILSAPIYWRGESFGNGSVSEQVITEIIWDLTELNLRFEVAAMDTHCHRGSADPKVRRQEVCQCFALAEEKNLYSVVVDQATEGLAASTLRMRAPFIVGLRSLMLDWRDVKRESLHPEVQATHEEGYLQKLEGSVAIRYIELFHGVFGRPPIVPHTLR